MKLVILSLIAFVLSAETFAQHRPTPRGPRYNPPRRSEPRYNPNPGRGPHRPAPGRVNRHPRRPGPVIVVGPRYSPRPGRVIHRNRRGPVVWRTGFTYACSPYGDLMFNGRTIHQFRFSSDCSQALRDIRRYGDFCDREDLYDRSGRLEAQFTFNYECRNALGYYY